MLPACLLALHFLQARGHSRVPVVRASPNMQPQAARTAVAAAADAAAEAAPQSPVPQPPRSPAGGGSGSGGGATQPTLIADIGPAEGEQRSLPVDLSACEGMRPEDVLGVLLVKELIMVRARLFLAVCAGPRCGRGLPSDQLRLPARIISSGLCMHGHACAPCSSPTQTHTHILHTQTCCWWLWVWCVQVDFESGHLSVGEVPLRPLPIVPCDTPLLDMMQLFQKGGSHMALLIQKRSQAAKSGACQGCGSV